MEPLASIAPVFLRPGGGGSGALSEGRVLVGEVLQRMEGGHVLIQVAGKKVPAETGVELEPGERFLVRVERQGGELLLRLVTPESREGRDALLDAVRGLLAGDQPLGELLDELATLLTSVEGPEARALLAAIEARRFDPQSGGAGLAQLLGADGDAWPVALAAALAEEGGDDFEAALTRLGQALRGVLGEAGLGGEELWGLERALAAALRKIGLELHPRADLAQLGDELARLLARELERGGAAAAARVSAKRGGGLFAGQELTLLRALLQTHGPLGGRSELARTLGEEAFARLGSDLRGRLALFLLGDAGERLEEPIGRALAGLDLEQLLNGVRREAGEARHVSLPLPDGSGWTTAHLFFPPPRRGGGGHRGGGSPEEGEGSYRVVMGVEFTRLGKVRADLLVRPGAVAARLRAARPSTAALLRGARGELEGLLGVEGRRVVLSILDGDDEEVSVRRLARDVEYLREHHLMDVEG